MVPFPVHAPGNHPADCEAGTTAGMVVRRARAQLHPGSSRSDAIPMCQMQLQTNDNHKDSYAGHAIRDEYTY